MFRWSKPILHVTVFLFSALSLLRIALAQTPAPATAALHEIRVEGLKSLSVDQVIALSQLQKDSQVGKEDLQAGADRLLQTGLFAKVNYKFQSKDQAVTLTFLLEESPRVPIYYDNFAWFPDSALNDAVRKKLPFFDGSLPEGGAVVDEAADAIKDLLASRNVNTPVEHQLLANPLGDGNVLQFHAQDSSFTVASVQFGDPAVGQSHTVQQALEAVIGKPYSRMAIDLFLAEQLRPFYVTQGLLRVKLGPPEVHLSGDPNKKLPDALPIFIPILTGPVYHWKDVAWTGNAVLSTITLSNALGLKTGDVADGMKIEAGWDRVREEYGRRGLLDVKIDPVASYDDQTHTISYAVALREGQPYRYNALVLTGLSLAAETRLKQAWPIPENAVFDKQAFEKFLTKLQTHPPDIFGDLPLHYESVGHWLRTDADKHQVDVLLDFK